MGRIQYREQINWEFVEGSAGSEQHCHSEKVAHTGVGISIEFQMIYRHTDCYICHFVEFFHEKLYSYPGDCHASVHTGSQ